jgi:apolipoprotein N-acyltransferase
MKNAVIAAVVCALPLAGCSKSLEGAPAAATAEPANKVGGEEQHIKKTAKPDPNAAARSETDAYIVEVRQAGDLSAGVDTKVEVVVIPKGEFHFNLEFPTSMSLAAPAGVSVDKAKQSLADAVRKDEKNGASWDVAMTVSDAGEKAFSCDVKFAVCTDKTCDPQKATVAWKVDVK